MNRPNVRLLFITLCSVLLSWTHARAIETDWQLITPRPFARSYSALASDSARGRLVLFGGFDGGGDSADTWEWDSVNWVQRTPTTSPPARYGHALAYDVARNRVVLFGGFDGGGILADTWEWDGTNWLHRTPATSPPARAYHALAYDGKRGSVVLFGGVGTTQDDMLADTWAWDGTNWTRQAPTTSPPAHYGHALAYDDTRERVVLFGGVGPTGFLADTWEWDGTNWTQQTPATIPSPRLFHSLAYDAARRRVVMFGGYGELGSYPYFADTWEWDGVNWAQRSPATIPTIRYAHAIAYDAASERVILFGGNIGLVSLGDTWEWDGTNWVERTPTINPPPRSGHALAYDDARERTVLFGGLGPPDFQSNPVLRRDTWEWDGINWVERTPAISPQARYGHALAYDVARDRVVLFGGFDGGRFLADTWEWETNWVHRTPATSPPARAYHALTYDAARGRVVLFGGYDAGVPAFGDTWEWDGTNWLERTSTISPAARWAHALTYDVARNRVVLFGGVSVSGILADTWEWDGVNWVQRTPATSPPARTTHALAYDSARGRVVLFGGSGPLGEYGYFADTWEWDGVNWVQRIPAIRPLARTAHALAYDRARERVVLFGGNIPGGWSWDTWEYGPTPEKVCDGADDNGNGVIDEGCDDDDDGYCDASMTVVGTPPVCIHRSEDCNDTDHSVHPNAVDLPGDNIDQDCSGSALCNSNLPYASHGEFMSCVSEAAAQLFNSGKITADQKHAIIVGASRSNVGKK